MEIFGFYDAFFQMNLMWNGISGVSINKMVGMFVISVFLWLGFFVLQGIGLWTMAKKKGFKKPLLAFVPFANLLLIDKLAGECEFFGHKIKRGGMYAMIAQITVATIGFLLIVVQAILFTKYADCLEYNSSTGTFFWITSDRLGMFLNSFYSSWGMHLYSITGLGYELLILVLMLSLLKRYTAKNYMMLSILQLLVPSARYIIIFVVRNNKAVDYNDYQRARYASYTHRTGYGNPYNPYGNPYGNPFGNPYGNQGQNQNGNSNSSNQGQQNPFDEFGSKDEDPFEDINNYSSNSSKTADSKKDKPDDKFF